MVRVIGLALLLYSIDHDSPTGVLCAVHLGAPTNFRCYEMESHIDVVEMVLNGIRFKHPSEDVRPPVLEVACSGGNRDIVRILLRSGANANATDRAGESPLDVASTAGVVRELINNGADINHRYWGREADPLMTACVAAKTAVVRELINCGANVGSCDWINRRPLHYAVEGRCLEAARLIMQAGGDPNATDKRGLTPLMMACSAGDESITTMLVNQGADTKAIDNRGHDAAWWALWQGHYNCGRIVRRSL